MKKIILSFCIAITLPLSVQAGVLDFIFGAGDGTVSGVQQWISTTTPSASIAQRIYGKAVQLSGLSDGCLQLSSSVITSTGSACGSGSGSGDPYPFQEAGNATTTLTQFNGGLTAYSSSTISALTVTTGTTTNATSSNMFSTTASSTNLFGSIVNFGNNDFVVDSAGDVGIGTNAPTQKFVVFLGSNEIVQLNNGSAASGIWGQSIGFLSQNSEAQFATVNAIPFVFKTGATRNSMTSGSELARLTTTGNFGLGTTSPYAKLSVVGETVASHFTATTTATSSFAGDLRFDGEIMPDGDECTVGQILKKAGELDWDCASDATGSGGAGLATSTDIADTEVIYGTSADDVGSEAAFTYDDATNLLKADNASTTLLSATTGFFNTFNATSTTGTSTITNALNIGTTTPTQATAKFVVLDTSGSLGADYGMILTQSTDSSGGNYDIRIDSPQPDIEFIETDGVGPEGEFEQGVNNDVFYFGGRNAADTGFEQIAQLYRLADGGRFVIGSTTPSVKFEIQDYSSSATGNFARLVNLQGSAGAAPGLAWYNSVGALDTARLSSAGGSSFANSNFRIQVADSSKVLQERFLIDVNGNVGIASSSPYAKLSVAGEVIARNFTATSTLDNTFPNLISTNSTTTNATTTDLHVSSDFNFGGDVFDELVGDGLAISAGDLIFDCSDVAGTGITCSGEDITAEVVTAGDGLTKTLLDFDCDIASASVFGCLSTNDWSVFNNKVSSTSIDTSAEVFALVTDETGGSGVLVGSVSPTLTGTANFDSILATASTTLQNFTGLNSTTTNATTTSIFSTKGNFSILCIAGDCQTAWPASGGSGGGSWSTTTSTVAGQLINYPNNATDIVAIGSNASTTAEFWFDPNTQTAALGTGASFFHAEADNSYFTGRLGLGTSSPYAKLSVVGQIVGAYFTATTTATSTFPNLLSTNATSTTLHVSGGAVTGALFDKPTIHASSTLVYDGAYGASGTTTYLMWNPSRSTTLTDLYCKTDVGTVWYEVGTGSATSTVQCTTSGATSATDVSFTARQNVYEALGTQASNPSRITVTPTFKWDN